MSEQRTKVGHRGSVIVVDDDADIRRFLKVVLQDAGFSVFDVADGDECFALLSRVTPVAILLDIEMPVWDGFKTCEKIRRFHPQLKCPIIFVTRRQTPADVRRAREVGADHFLVKPLSAETVIERLTHFLQKKHRWQNPNPER